MRALLVVLGCALPLTALAQTSGTPAPVTVTLAYNNFLQLSFTDAPPPLDVIRAELAARHPHITLDFFTAPDTVEGFRDAIVVWMVSQDGEVDLYGIDTPWVPEFGLAGWAAPLNDALPTLEDSFVPAGLDVFSYEGQRLGVPFWGSVGGLYYRADLLEQYGYGVPATYDDLLAAARAITTADRSLTGFLWNGARDEGLIQVWTEVFLGFGGSYTTDDGACAFNSAAGVAALTFLVGTIAEGLSPAQTPSWTSAEARTRFVEGNALFLRHNGDLVTWLDDPERSNVAGVWGLAPNPAQPGGRASGATGGYAFALNPYSDAPDAALLVLEVIASEAVQKGFALAWGPVQYYQGLYEDADVQAANPNADRLDVLLPSAAPRPASTAYAELSVILQEELHRALTNQATPQAALDAACARIARLPA